MLRVSKCLTVSALRLIEWQTDDVGIFGSALSNEYLLVATHFKIPPTALIGLSKSAVRASFAGRKHMMHLIDRFEQCGMKNSQDAVKP